MTDILQDRLGPAGDRFYAELMAAQRALSNDEAQRFNARLILLMANTIGDGETLSALIREAARHKA
ncbi:DUF2783 domain-containing protein [Georhizobium profundi]|jgi:hypothetical protein|uniref:DUF2783 domain-containing protein n=1 Tax=Georhizobium profundi TaxID=2341112 RepID=A0A3Q8XNI2_9HYPH|nr:DUF2783 domain-containing protein [Georhizobium profundi]AZN71658.1 DUF2783 domain-containing protein [Georhizobium profundi]